ncbi:MAG: hypothetical protein J0I41_03445 [Filimonas sp.]|nr:hypothetical protein [Filimonas sp.]
MKNTDQPAGVAKHILTTTLIAGTLDLVSVWLIYGPIKQKTDMGKILKGIAGGAFGKSAYGGGSDMIVYGLFFHYLIACCFTLAYFLLYPKIAFLRRHVVLSGLLYGIVAWVWMNIVILPMTNVPRGPFKIEGVVIGMLLLMFFIGLPISLLTHAYYTRKK